MIPIGNHIQISTPETLTKSYFILEKEAVMKAGVIEVSSDYIVPFNAGDTVYFYTGREIVHPSGIYLNIEMIVGYII